ncbi:Gfo/Idh/MocA family oxidoreductase [Peribacillus simplex]|uniref:Gfo/Idh/MocA family oxidoreductase n=1 Tax=Peribacillus simplex TaxID=1478 RepID=UPI0021AA9B1C|nr:Gfo/Idh/MocA family oxidoreductase [Peribacillus simplex]
MNKLNVGLIGAGRMGAFHGETLAYRLPQAKLYAVAAPAPGAAEKIYKSIRHKCKSILRSDGINSRS